MSCYARFFLALAASATMALATDNNTQASLPVAASDSIVVEASGGETGVARLRAEAADLPAAATALSADDLAARGARDSDDALLAVPGINLQTQNGVFGFFLLRGVDSLAGGAILSDGVVEPEATRYPLYVVDRVEVLRGPASFAWGAGSLAGAVNLIRERPLFERGASARVEFGSFETASVELDGSLGDPTSNLAFRASGLFTDSEGFRPQTESRLTGFAPSLTWRLGDGGILAVDAEVFSSDVRPDAGIPILGTAPVAVDDETFYGTSSDDSNQDLTRLHVDYTRRLTGTSLLRTKAYYHRLEWQSSGTILAGPLPTPVGILLNRLETNLDDDQQFSGVQAEWLGELGPERRHEISAGLEISRRQDDFSLDVGVLAPVDPFAPVDFGTGVLFPLPQLAERGDADTLLISPWVVDRIRLRENLEIWGGLRFDSLDYEDTAAQVDDDDSEVSPFLGVAWQASSDWRVWANAGRAFAPPSTRLRGDRDPQTSEQVEIGARWARGGVRAGVSAFQLDRDEIAIPDFTGITATTGSQRARGLELEVSVDLAAGTRIAGWWTYTDAELTEFRELVQIGPGPTDFALLDRAGNTPAFTPRHLARIEATRLLPAGFDVALGARWIGSQYTAESNSVEIDEALLVEAGIGWTRGAWRTALRLSNLTDEETYQRGQGDLAVIPADPLAARLEVATKW